MTGIPLLAVGFILAITLVLFVVVSLALVLIVLIQKGRGGGLSSAFGGGMASGLLGSKTGDFLTWVTIVMVVVFLSLAVVMAKYYRPSVSGSSAAGVGSPSSTATEQTQDANVLGQTKADANL